uniref:Uncharacterized protein n=1 Tax=Romanomermis culicivorax TaxID=13658 RepID=A0A915IXL4_ROMCU
MFFFRPQNRAAILEPSSPSLTPCTVARCGKKFTDRENASLENLFKIVSPDVSNISASPPQPSKKRRPPSPAFSDVSDADEAPTLERHLLSSPPPPQHEMKTPPKKKKEPQPETSSFLAAPLLPYDAIFVAQPPTFFAPPQPLPSKKNEKTQDAADVKSPPVQRHLHTHHHTHAYPALLTSAAAAVDPYAALLAAGQQAAAAAAAGIVGAYPPYVPK